MLFLLCTEPAATITMQLSEEFNMKEVELEIYNIHIITSTTTTLQVHISSNRFNGKI